MTPNKNSKLRSLHSFQGFYLGQLEGEYIRTVAEATGNSSRSDALICASNAFDFTKKIAHNYPYILKNKDDAVKIADYLCVINWLGRFYDEFDRNWTNPKYQSLLKQCGLYNQQNYFVEAADYYSFAYRYLNDRFYDDESISDTIKSQVYRLND